MLPALLFSLLFLAPAWLLWWRDQRGWAIVPLATTLILLGFTIALASDAGNYRQAKADTLTLLRELEQPDLLAGGSLVDVDEQLFFAATASTALRRARRLFPEYGTAIDSSLYRLAYWLTEEADLRAWRRNADWDREVYFLAQAGVLLVNFEMATGRPDFQESTRAIGNHLGRRLHRSRYKHLGSHPGEDFYRPADNAAALYTLKLYDRLYVTEYSAENYRDWARYLSEELFYAESRLPCAAFSEDNRCYLEPSATATGAYVAYRAAAGPTDDIPWREWLHYFGETSLSPFSLTIRPNMRENRQARFCDQGARPLRCERYEQAIGLWAAAENDGEYAFFRLYTALALQRWFFDPIDYAAYSPASRLQLLTEVAVRTMGTTVSR